MTGQPYAMLRDDCTYLELITIQDAHNDLVYEREHGSQDGA